MPYNKTRQTGRPSIFNEEHAEFVLNFVDNNPSIVVEDVMEKLLEEFSDLKISKTNLQS